MAKSRWTGTAVLVLCATLSSLWSFTLRQDAQGGIKMVDFGEIYYGAKCALLHKDPYNSGTVLQEFKAEGGRFPKDPYAARVAPIVTSNGVNLPTALVLLAPLAVLPWGVTQTLWAALTAGLLALAACLLWDLGAKAAPVLWIVLAGFILMNCENLLILGNVAGVSVSLCVVAAWCFLRERYALAGVMLLAISLVLKPHDAGLIWLYFLLAGGALRKRALQTLLVTGVLGLAAVVWIAPVSPHWVRELSRNLDAELVRGGVDDPGPLGLGSRNIAQIVDLQAVISVFDDDPHFYNPASYLIAGSLILIWAFAVMKRRFAQGQAPLALAAISAFTLLPVYHRPYDAKLLLLAIPACAMLWPERGPRRWVALILTSAGILVTSDIPIAIVLGVTHPMSFSASTFAGKMLMLLLLRPAPLVLLAIGCFYLWIFIRYNPAAAESSQQSDAADKSAAAMAT